MYSLAGLYTKINILIRVYPKNEYIGQTRPNNYVLAFGSKRKYKDTLSCMSLKDAVRMQHKNHKNFIEHINSEQEIIKDARMHVYVHKTNTVYSNTGNCRVFISYAQIHTLLELIENL